MTGVFAAFTEYGSRFYREDAMIRILRIGSGDNRSDPCDVLADLVPMSRMAV